MPSVTCAPAVGIRDACVATVGSRRRDPSQRGPDRAEYPRRYRIDLRGPTMADTSDAERLREERDALEKRVETLEARPERRRKTRVVFTAILLILAVLCFTVAVPGLW